MVQIIAEMCQNHKGDLGILEKMVRAAADADADYAKIQSMLAKDLTFRKRFETGKIENCVVKVIKRPYQPEYDRLKPMDLDDNVHWKFIEMCNNYGIKPLTTVYSRSRIPFIASLPFKAIKVPSYDCASYPMIRELKQHFKHLFVSTGATFDNEIEKTANILKGYSFTFLHCVTIYPTPLEDAQLSRIKFLKKFTPGVGFSDHCDVEKDSIKISIVAMRYGIDVIERHFTILDRKETKDGPVSIDPNQLRELVEFARMKKDEINEYVEKHIPNYKKMLGKPNISMTQTDLLNRDYYRGRFASKVDGKIIYNWEDKGVDYN